MPTTITPVTEAQRKALIYANAARRAHAKRKVEFTNADWLRLYTRRWRFHSGLPVNGTAGPKPVMLPARRRRAA